MTSPPVRVILRRRGYWADPAFTDRREVAASPGTERLLYMWCPKARKRSVPSAPRRSIASLTVLAMVASTLAFAAPAARAADNGVEDLLGVLGSGGDPTHNLA